MSLEQALQYVLEGDNRALDVLLKDLDDVDVPIEGKALLLWACEVANDEGAELLLNAGANADARSETGETAFMLAAHNGLQRAALKIPPASVYSGRPDDMGRDELMHVASGGGSEILKYLIKVKSGLDANTDFEGRTALQWALIGGDCPEFIDELLRLVNFDESMRRKAIAYAEMLKREKSLEILKGMGA